jgi:hypothetical protein
MRKKRLKSSVKKSGSLKRKRSHETQHNLPAPPGGLAWRREQFDRQIAAHEQKLRIQLLVKQLEAMSQRTVTASATSTESSGKNQLLERGKHCHTIREEIGRIRNMSGVRGMSIAEIQAKTHGFLVWDLVKQLPQEEQETFRQPRQWGPTAGYARRLLGHYYGKSPETVKGWIKAYRKGSKM